MVRNMGGIDRGLRMVVGAALVVWALTGSDAYHLWGLLGIVPLATGLVGWCPAYLPFGFRTCKSR